MKVKVKGVLGIAAMIMMIAGIIMTNPAEVKALPVGADLYAHEVLLGGSVILDVYAAQVDNPKNPGVGDNDYQYFYIVQGIGVNLYSISVGNVDPITPTVKYTVDAYHLPVVSTSPSRLGPTSLVAYFLPSGLEPGSVVDDLWITYDSFIATQNITITAVGSGGTVSLRPNYTTGGDGTIPEPGTLLMLGSGMITLWFLSRRKRKI
jgi:hypothetical protein